MSNCLKELLCCLRYVHHRVYNVNLPLSVVCETLTAPDNGDIDCSLGNDGLPTNRDTCSFTCDDGFMLNGSETRTCRIRRGRATWSGDEATCVPSMYEYLWPQVLQKEVL